jgi:hypothetical protein
MPSADEFDTIIQAVNAGYPQPEAGPVKHRRQPHPVLAFEVGTILFLAIAILGYVLVWLLRHG